MKWRDITTRKNHFGSNLDVAPGSRSDSGSNPWLKILPYRPENANDGVVWELPSNSSIDPNSQVMLMPDRSGITTSRYESEKPSTSSGNSLLWAAPGYTQKEYSNLEDGYFEPLESSRSANAFLLPVNENANKYINTYSLVVGRKNDGSMKPSTNLGIIGGKNTQADISDGNGLQDGKLTQTRLSGGARRYYERKRRKEQADPSARSIGDVATDPKTYSEAGKSISSTIRNIDNDYKSGRIGSELSDLEQRLAQMERVLRTFPQEDTFVDAGSSSLIDEPDYYKEDLEEDIKKAKLRIHKLTELYKKNMQDRIPINVKPGSLADFSSSIVKKGAEDLPGVLLSKLGVPGEALVAMFNYDQSHGDAYLRARFEMGLSPEEARKYATKEGLAEVLPSLVRWRYPLLKKDGLPHKIAEKLTENTATEIAKIANDNYHSKENLSVEEMLRRGYKTWLYSTLEGTLGPD